MNCMPSVDLPVPGAPSTRLADWLQKAATQHFIQTGNASFNSFHELLLHRGGQLTALALPA